MDTPKSLNAIEMFLLPFISLIGLQWLTTILSWKRSNETT